MYKGRAKSVKYQGDSSRAVDRTYKGRAKSVGDSSKAVDRKYKGRAKSVGDSSRAVDRMYLWVTAQELLTERIRGEQNL